MYYIYSPNAATTPYTTYTRRPKRVRRDDPRIFWSGDDEDAARHMCLHANALRKSRHLLQQRSPGKPPTRALLDEFQGYRGGHAWIPDPHSDIIMLKDFVHNADLPGVIVYLPRELATEPPTQAEMFGDQPGQLLVTDWGKF